MSTQEVHYFADPQLDRVVGLVWQLAAELHVTTQRCRALEALLARKGVLEPGELDTFTPGGEEQAALDGTRDQMFERLLRVLTEDGPSEHPLRGEALRSGNGAGGTAGAG